MFWGENFPVGPRKKHLNSTFFFSLPLPTKHPSKGFPSSFSLMFFFILSKILPKTNTSKSMHTLFLYDGVVYVDNLCDSNICVSLICKG